MPPETPTESPVQSAPIPSVSPVVAPSQPKKYPGKVLGIWGFVLSFVSPQIFGLVLSIIAFQKSKKAGFKNPLSLAGIIISSILLFFGIIVTIILIALLPTIEGAIQQQNSVLKTGFVTGKVTTACYTYNLPATYVGAVTAHSCTSGANTSKDADDLSAVKVHVITDKVSGDPVDFLQKELATEGLSGTKATAITVGGYPAAQAVIDDGTGDGIQNTYVLIPAPGNKVWTDNGAKVYAYSIGAYTYNKDLRSAFTTVLNSIKFTVPAVDGLNA